MSKKTNTIILLIGATFFNIIVTILSFLLFLVIFSRFFYSRLPEDSIAWALPSLFILAIIASVFIYRMALKIVMKKVEMEKYFDPIFNRRPARKQ